MSNKYTILHRRCQDAIKGTRDWALKDLIWDLHVHITKLREELDSCKFSLANACLTEGATQVKKTENAPVPPIVQHSMGAGRHSQQVVLQAPMHGWVTPNGLLHIIVRDGQRVFVYRESPSKYCESCWEELPALPK